MNAGYDVVVVGAGPVGQLTALMVADRGRRVALVERWTAPYPLPRAIGISGEARRLLQNAGLADVCSHVVEEIPAELAWVCWQAADGTELLRHPVPIADAGDGWPAFASFAQPELERVLEERTQAHPGVDVLRGQEVTAVTQDAATATVTLRPQARRGEPPQPGPGTVTGRLVVGADGANSTVRRAMGVPVDELDFASEWLVVDVQPHHERTWTPHFAQVLDPARPTTVVPAGPPAGRRRFEFMKLPGETSDQLARAETVWRLLQRWDLTPHNATLVRHAVYTFGGRWARSWHDGRLVLAGDAAHLMPPFLAQGFNSGLRDVAALTWRIELFLAGMAPLELFDSYTSERCEHVRVIVEQAVGAGRALCVTDPAAAMQRDAAMCAAQIGPAAGGPAFGLAPWRLGPGLRPAGDAVAGLPSVQARVAVGARTGLFDDLVGRSRFVLLCRSAAPALGPEARAAWHALDGRIALLAPAGDVVDVDGSYGKWLGELGADVALIRPDFHLHSTATDIAQADALVRGLAADLRLTLTEETS